MKHFLFDLLRIVGLRDRLRCPRCKAVGTWKPHGGWLDREDRRGVRRWMCKWCGLYRGPERGEESVVPSPEMGVWILLSSIEDGEYTQDHYTPSQVHREWYGECGVWPWRG